MQVGARRQSGDQWGQKDTLGDEHVMHYADDALLSCMLEICMVLSTSVTPINRKVKMEMVSWLVRV